MDIGFSDLFASEQVLFAFAAVLCAVGAAAGLRLYQRDFHGRSDGDTDPAVLAAVCAAGTCCGLYFSGAETVAGLLALVQSAVVCVYIIRDLRGIAGSDRRALRRKDNELADLKTELDAFKTAHGELAAKLAVMEPSLRQLERIGTAVANMPAGLALFDAQQRLLYCNPQFTEVHRLPAEMAREGVSYDDMLACRMANGEYPDESLESAESWRRGELSRRGEISVVARRNDGHAIETTFKLLPGGERVATCTDISELQAAATRMAKDALTDTLTGLPGRVPFLRHVDEALARMRRSGSPLAVLMLDIDHLKGVNDSLGLQVGDKLLQLVAERLRDLMRTTDVIARLRGDCFAILADSMSEDRDAALLGQRLLDVLAVPYLIDGHQICISVSIGIAIAPNDASETEALLDNARTALRRAKGDGRNACRFFEQDFDTRIRAQRSLEAELRTGLARGELELFFQPVLDVAASAISGFEALVRWHHPERGLLLPQAFLPVAEESGLIHPVGRWIVREACARAASWPKHLKLIVNVSRAQLADRELVATLGNALATGHLAPDRLEVDVPELAMIDAEGATLAVLSALRDMGASIALDDFGSAYAPLTYLQAFPFDRIKIGRAFMRTDDKGHEPQFLLRAVATLAEGFRIATTAKFVETGEQLDLVRKRRYSEAQGFLISPPMPAEDIASFLKFFNPKALSGWSRVAG